MAGSGAAAAAANARVIVSVFEKYQKERLQFVQTVADLASRESNIEALQAAGVMALLRPLLLDGVPAIQHAAALALGRLANYSADMADAVVDSDILPQLVYSLAEQNRFYKKAAAFVLRAVAKHSPELARSVVDSGALNALVSCLEEFDPGVKEAAAWALGYIARHNGDSNSVTFIAPLLANTDSKLRRQVCSALSQISKHSVDLAETVVDGEVFPGVLNCLKDSDGYVRKNAATLICEIAKHTPEVRQSIELNLAQLIVSSGGIAAVVDYVNESRGNAMLPGIMTLGYIAAFSETLALSVIVAKGVPPLTNALVSESEDHIKIGRHSPDHAKTLADNAVLPKLLHILTSAGGGDVGETGSDLKTKAKRALKCILEKTLHLEALEPLLDSSTPANILKYVVAQFAKILPNNVAARRAFVTSGGLQRIQEIANSLGRVGAAQTGAAGASEGAAGILNGTKIGEYIRVINECYPEEIVRYYSPGYSATLLDKIEEFSRAARGGSVTAMQSGSPASPAKPPVLSDQTSQQPSAVAV
ncbi:Sperm-associated antigen 6 [Cladochytrium tenue]|nr:Sperm-associated antigen 6 [Cladochytrium tenue]